MSIIEQAARRLEELRRAGVDVPWAAAGLSEREATNLAGIGRMAAVGETPPEADASAEPAVAAARPAQVVPIIRAPARPFSRIRTAPIDIEGLMREGHLVPGQRRSALMDEFRGIKRPLLKGARGNAGAPLTRGNLIMVTSALPGEGKTFCAINLALSMAMEVDISVLLVDSDVVRPSVVSRLGIAGDFRGLLDVLSDPAVDIDTLVLGTNVDKLMILPAGRQRFNSTELLASGAMETMLDGLARDHPDLIVIFDAPPLLVTTESKVLATRVGQVLVVVDQGKTSPQDVAKAFSILSDVPVVSSLLNKSRAPSDTDRYGYYEA
jgi:protein-tyrosine kinase